MTGDNKLERYAFSREQLLASIADHLVKDERFTAAWLAGSYGRGEADAVSDLDLNVAVAQPFDAVLCARPWQTAGRTTPERLALFGQFGEIALVYEAHQNAPGGGTLSSVLYSGPAVMVDWTLIPQGSARIPAQARLLFDKAGLPSDPQPEYLYPGDTSQIISEQSAFFWMMMAVTAKYIVRGDTVSALKFLDLLYRVQHDLEGLAAGKSWAYHRGSLAPLATTQKDQAQAIRSLGAAMEKLILSSGKISGDAVFWHPMREIEALLSLIEVEQVPLTKLPSTAPSPETKPSDGS